MSARAFDHARGVSLVFFLITATTFSSLGVVLPAMIGELHWSWGGAGTGFSLLGVFRGHHRHHSRQPDPPLRRARHPGGGQRGDGGGVSLPGGDAWSGALFPGLLCWRGLGFTLLATVPGTYLLARLFAQPVFRLRALFHRRRTGRRGRAAALSLGRRPSRRSWRAYWLVSLVIVTVAGLAQRDAGGCEDRCARAAMKRIPTSPRDDWTRQGGAEDAAIRHPGRRLQHLSCSWTSP